MTAPEIIAVLNSALFRDSRSEKAIAKAAGLGVNTIRHFRNKQTIRLDTLTMLCNTLGLEVVVREKTGRKEGK